MKKGFSFTIEENVIKDLDKFIYDDTENVNFLIVDNQY